MKLHIKEGVSCRIYLADPVPNHQWSIDTRLPADKCFLYNPGRIAPNQELLVDQEQAFYEYVTSQKYNTYLATRDTTDDKERFPLTKKIADINKLTFLNLAASTFISNDGIADVYKKEGAYAKWFFERLENGNLETTIIINNPHSNAARDAALSKMNPHGLKLEKDEIIQHNINTLLKFKKEHKGAKIDLYLTDICLPYGIMYAENTEDESKTYMKVDLYSPMGGQGDYRGFDNERPSFYLMRNNPDTSMVCGKFLDVIDRVKNDKKRTKHYTGKNLKWLLKKPIIHRGRFSRYLPEHSVRGYFACISNRYPMEIDILFLKDQTMLVGRDEVVIHKETNEKRRLSELTIEQIRAMKTDEYYSINQTELKYKFEELMTIDELLALVNGKVGLVIELKIDAEADHSTYERVAKSIISSLRYYEGDYCIHAANPYVLRAIRELDETIILGQISWSFDKTDISEQYRKIHTDITFMKINTPDFISYKISEVRDNDNLMQLCNNKEQPLPLLTWTILNKEDEEIFRKLNIVQKNVIIEGAPTYMN